MLDDLDLDPADKTPSEIPEYLPDVPDKPLATHAADTAGIGAFRGLFFAIPIALVLWAIAGGLVYLFI